MIKYSILEDFVNNPHQYDISLTQNGVIVVELPFKYEIHIWSDCIHTSRLHNYNWTCVNSMLYGTLWEYGYTPVPNGKNLTHELYEFKTFEPLNHKIELLRHRLKKYTAEKNFMTYASVYYYRWSDGPSCSIVSLTGTKPASFEPRIASPLHEVPKKNIFEWLHSSAIPLIVEGACEKIKKARRL